MTTLEIALSCITVFLYILCGITMIVGMSEQFDIAVKKVSQDSEMSENQATALIAGIVIAVGPIAMIYILVTR